MRSHDLAVMRGSEAHRAALAHLVDAELTSESSEATLLHSVMEAGIKAVQQQVEDQSYAQIAADGLGVPAHRGPSSSPVMG